ncbi:MAG: hypothetical protein NAOJABEB_02972 [Steroidobacteraceae bacterium]|nr:hypothetical protein [Steroidobacteraceae bacterium]
MPETLASIKTKVASVLQDTPALLGTGSAGDVELAIREALEVYDDDVPRTIVADVAGDGTAYDFSLPTGFVDGYSRIVSVEYPIGDRPATLLPSDEYGLYRTTSATKVRLATVTPDSGESFRITYTGRHTLTDLDSAAATTIYAYHTEAFVNLAAAKCLMRLANRFVHEQESTLNLDAVDRNSKTDIARRMADKLIAAYREVVGVTRGESPSSARVNWDARLGGVLSPLTHRTR